jgi:predicted sulfurtransferase
MLTSFDDMENFGLKPEEEKPMGHWRTCLKCGNPLYSTEACECTECKGTVCEDCSACGEEVGEDAE